MPLLSNIVNRAKKELNTIKQDLNIGNNANAYQHHDQQQQGGQQGYPGQGHQSGNQQQNWVGQNPSQYGQQQYQQQQSYPGQGQQPYPPPSQQPGPPQWQQPQSHANPQQQQQQQYDPAQQHLATAPAIPHASRPYAPQPPNPSTIHQFSFHVSQPVSAQFTQKLGAGGWGNAELQTYTNSSTNSLYTPESHLLLRAISQPNHPDASQRYTSARLVSHQTLSAPKGYLSTTLSVPSAVGIWPAFWLLPAEPFSWPGDGEVDISESWQGSAMNHTCLHWGHFNGEDSQKHRVVETVVKGLGQRWVRYEFAWEEDDQRGLRMVWWIDGKVVMKTGLARGTLGRRLSDFQIVVNIAMGGNVCGGQAPREGVYEMRVAEIKIARECEGGWGRFETDFQRGREGKGM